MHKAFVAELVKACEKYNAALFPRTDGKRQILSMQVGELWLDFVRIDRDGARPLPPKTPEDLAKARSQRLQR